MTLRSLNSPTPTPEERSSPPSSSSSFSSSSSLSSSSTLILWYCVTISCLIVAVLWLRYYRIKLQRQRQEAVLQLASIIMHNRRAVAGEDVESGRGVDHVENNNSESITSSNMELIERTLFGPDEADEIFSNARSALALSSAAAAIAERSSSFSRPWNNQNHRRHRSQNFDRIEASVLAAHQMLDRLEAEHRRRKKEKYMKLVRALGCTSMIVQEYHLVHDDDTPYKIRDKDDSGINQPGEIMDSNNSEGNANIGLDHHGEGSGAKLEQEESTIGAAPVPTTPVSPSALLTKNNLNNTLQVVEENCSSVDDENDDEENKQHVVLLIPLCTESLQHDAMATTGTTSSSVTATKSTIHRNVPSTCAICLMQYQVGSHVSWSSNEECRHVFHRDCILLWLLKKRSSGDERRHVCPCCRREFVSESMLFNVDDEPTRTDGNET